MKRNRLLRYWAVPVAMLLSAGRLAAQNEPFASDRPGLSDSPDLIHKKNWQLSTGFDISKYNHYGIYQFSQNTLKYGVGQRLEARMDFSLQYDQREKKISAPPPSIGMKALLLKQRRFLPKVALIAEYYPPGWREGWPLSGAAVELCFSHGFKNNNSVYYNAGLDWTGLHEQPVFNSLVGFSYAVSPRLAAFTEIYTYKQPVVKLSWVTDIGATYLLTTRLQADFACGLNLTRPDGDYYFDGGITYNF